MHPTLFTTPGLRQFAEAIDAERQAQLAKWGDQRHPDGTALTEDDLRADKARHVCQAMARLGQVTWRDILNEEIAEAFAEKDPHKLRTELIQCAAVIQAWVSDIDRRAVAEFETDLAERCQREAS
ncbi:hypothetical protein ACWELB_20945 [Streptomyces asiaticus]